MRHSEIIYAAGGEAQILSSYIYDTDFVADVCPILCGKVSSLGMDPTVDSGD